MERVERSAFGICVDGAEWGHSIEQDARCDQMTLELARLNCSCTGMSIAVDEWLDWRFRLGRPDVKRDERPVDTVTVAESASVAGRCDAWRLLK